jgi:hypothetical protein
VASNTSAFDGASGLGEQEHGVGGSSSAHAEALVAEEEGTGGAARSSRRVLQASDAHDDDADAVEHPDAAFDSPKSIEQAATNARFHALMMCAACYVCMTLSAWGSQSSAEGDASASLSNANMWIKIVTQWVCLLLFAWTLLARRICPNRDFS